MYKKILWEKCRMLLSTRGWFGGGKIYERIQKDCGMERGECDLENRNNVKWQKMNEYFFFLAYETLWIGNDYLMGK